MDLLSLDLYQTADLLARREVTCVEVTQHWLARLRQVDNWLNCCVDIDDESALKKAEAADGLLAAGCLTYLLHGIPLAHKDVFYRRDRVSSAGSRVFSDRKAPYTACVNERLDNAGAIEIGVLQSAECALSPTGFNAVIEPPRNPWNTEYLPGGSSSGSGAAVAARAVLASIGSDTGGSVRHPAALSGVVGLKPTYGRISRRGMIPLAQSLDCPGILTRTARDCAILLGTIAGYDTLDGSSAWYKVPDYESFLDGDLTSIRIGIPDQYYYDGIDPDICDLVNDSIDILVDRGASVHTVQTSNIAQLNELARVVLSAESFAVHSEMLDSQPDNYGTQVRARLECGRSISASVYIDALRVRGRMLRTFLDEAFERVDVLHVPCVPVEIPRAVDEMRASVEESLSINEKITRCTRAINYLGLPAVSVPCGFKADGLPTAFQLIGKPMDESLLLKVADAYQRDTEWQHTVPRPVRAI